MSTINHDAVEHQFSTELDYHRAILDYRLNGNEMTITHTGVPDAIGGRGVGAELMKAAVATARHAGWSIVPACSYAAAYMRRHPEDTRANHLDELLDEALEDSFPASDPPSIGGSN